MIRELQKQERPVRRQAGGTLLCVEAWQSGLLHRAFLPADLWASKPLAVTDLRKDAAHRYIPCPVAVSREVVAGVPAEISTSFVERANLSSRGDPGGSRG